MKTKKIQNSDSDSGLLNRTAQHIEKHPSGDPTPSEADVKVTRDLIRAGQLLKIEVLDHIILGNPKHSSLRELGYIGQ